MREYSDDFVYVVEYWTDDRWVAFPFPYPETQFREAVDLQQRAEYEDNGLPTRVFKIPERFWDNYHGAP